MKRIRCIDGVELYDLIKDRKNILLAIKNAAKDHAKDPDVIMMKENPNDYVSQIQEIFENEDFHYSKFITKDIIERGKPRHLCYTRTFPDRVIQHAVLQIVGPILTGTCPKDTYAAQDGRGTHKCSLAVRKAIKNDPENTKYYLKADIHKYFDSIDRHVLFKMIKRKIKCPRTLRLIHTLIFEVPGKRGLAIGLYLSQVMAVYMLSGFVHFVKEVLRAAHFFLYMDDWVVLASSKRILHRIRKVATEYLEKVCHLHVKKNWCIRPVSTGLDFVGYVHYPTHTAVRKCNKLRFKNACRSIVRNLVAGKTVTVRHICRAESYRGMVDWCDGKHLLKIFLRILAMIIQMGDKAHLSERASVVLAKRLDEARQRIAQYPSF